MLVSFASLSMVPISWSKAFSQCLLVVLSFTSRRCRARRSLCSNGSVRHHKLGACVRRR